jgi:hypothetical protein
VENCAVEVIDDSIWIYLMDRPWNPRNIYCSQRVSTKARRSVARLYLAPPLQPSTGKELKFNHSPYVGRVDTRQHTSRWERDRNERRRGKESSEQREKPAKEELSRAGPPTENSGKWVSQ